MFLLFLTLLIIIYLVASFFIAYHLLKYAYDTETRIMGILFSIGVVVFIILLLFQYHKVDFSGVFSGENGFNLNPFE